MSLIYDLTDKKSWIILTRVDHDGKKVVTISWSMTRTGNTPARYDHPQFCRAKVEGVYCVVLFYDKHKKKAKFGLFEQITVSMKMVWNCSMKLTIGRVEVQNSGIMSWKITKWKYWNSSENSIRFTNQRREVEYDHKEKLV